MNDQLKARLKGIQEVLMAHHRATKLLPSAAKGDEREVLAREFLAKVFPAPYRFGSGAVTDAAGNLSGQLDVIIEWPFFASFPSPLGIHRLYLAESVAFIIEVKSNLIAQWAEVENMVQQVRPLQRLWRSYVGLDAASADFHFMGPTISRIPVCVVGFTGYKTVESLRERMLATSENRRPDTALVIESGAYVGWYGPSSANEQGLFSFCTDCSFFLRNVLFAEPDLATYVSSSYDG